MSSFVKICRALDMALPDRAGEQPVEHGRSRLHPVKKALAILRPGVRLRKGRGRGESVGRLRQARIEQCVLQHP